MWVYNKVNIGVAKKFEIPNKGVITVKKLINTNSDDILKSILRFLIYRIENIIDKNKLFLFTVII